MLLFFYINFILLQSATCRVVQKSEAPIIETSDGKVLGIKSVTFTQKEFYRFQGIPYAASPVGNLRFADPQPTPKWNHLKDCTGKKTILCMQHSKENETEDCLILNVYTPKLPKSQNDSDLAVMVYIHGGGFYEGNSTYESYGPQFFMDQDVVIVSMNYRLGIFGFLSTSDETILGNYGLKDQILALKWVQKNIKAFGGDPSKVLIFGNSAGSASVGFHILNKENEGLFRAAIMSSGTPLNSWSVQKNPRKIAFELARIFNRTSPIKNSKELLSYLRTSPVEVLMKTFLNHVQIDYLEIDQILNGYFYAPSSNPLNGFLVNPIYESLEKGNFFHVPIMMGYTSEELLFSLIFREYWDEILEKYDSNHEFLVSNIYDRTCRKEIGNIIHELYNKNNETMQKNIKNVIKFWSDFVFNNGIRKFAELASKYTNLFFYQFSFRGELAEFQMTLEGLDSVAHTDDLNYIWLRSKNSKKFENLSEIDKITHKRMIKFYTNFAKHLNPTFNNDPLFQGILWKPVNVSGNDITSYLDINTELKMRINPKHETYSKWHEIFLKYALKPYNTV